ncbi:hypothetical protein SAMN02745247_01659 [Butyrivibrio hungatei DSM 14810]|uniref:Metallo-beta-lactamase superfamily protein n=1 Tax=Butyrivibrio hungatei DSM 14810 TaxID=1121132 RepID=A0A1M7SFG3_9FIRM|nr:hypothetical protein [Butyrivibrio hungatei]SHN57184.1 hypothetical protein SAMN02745247_01659 [Butyrivibrio hungatei DSM 14810]
MAKEIEMYNTYFGDCFIVKNEDSNLLVDFGVRRNSKIWHTTYTGRRTLLSDIAEDIANRYKKQTISLLITHFHDDHVSGLVKMQTSGLPQYKNLFKKIYIPDIWDNPFIFITNSLEKIVLESQLRKTKLPYTTSSLFDLIAFICINCRSTYLLSRGVEFENGKYRALWPPKGIEINDFEEYFNSLPLPNDLKRDLLRIATQICTYVQSSIYGDFFDYSVISIEKTIKRYERQYKKAIKDYKNQIEDLVDFQTLNELNHKINIVFHDSINNTENMLFTGDAEDYDMNTIATATDYPLHEKYKYIKIPHHGTTRHYFNFSRYVPEHVLIPNGEVNFKDPATHEAYKIDERYGLLTSRHTCSNCNNCKACDKACHYPITCIGSTKNVVFPLLYTTIR